MRIRIFLATFAAAMVGVTFVHAEDASYVRARLVMDLESAQAGDTIRVGFEYQMPEHGHIYWRNSGTSGFATGIEWELPEGATAGPLQWPAPSLFEDPIINDTTYGYEGQVVLFAEITLPPDVAPGLSFDFLAKSYWLVCLEDGECIPETAEAEGTITISDSKQASQDASVIDAATDLLPVGVPSSAAPVVAKVGGGRNHYVELTTKRGAEFVSGDDAKPTFFPYTGEPWILEESETSPTRLLFRPTGPVEGFGSGVVRFEIAGAAPASYQVHVGIRPEN